MELLKKVEDIIKGESDQYLRYCCDELIETAPWQDGHVTYSAGYTDCDWQRAREFALDNLDIEFNDFFENELVDLNTVQSLRLRSKIFKIAKSIKP